MRTLTVEQVLALHARIVDAQGSACGIRDRGALESAVAQPQMGFGETELYPTLIEKVAALGFSLASNHPFVDGNKRIAHAAMEVTLLLNGYEFDADIDDGERTIMALAAGTLTREELTEWVRRSLRRIDG